jgi:hypothetical protein
VAGLAAVAPRVVTAGGGGNATLELPPLGVAIVVLPGAGAAACKT